MSVLKLINELNGLSKYGITISSNDIDQNELGNDDIDVSEIKTCKMSKWKVTSHFNPCIGEISYTVENESLEVALKEVTDWCKRNLK